MLNDAIDTDTKARAARLEARVTVDQKALLQQAATLSGRTLSDFVVASAQEAAARVIQEHETIRLSRAEQVAFVNALLKPRAPTARLRKAAAKYRQQTGL
ncbi:MAG: type II toxin-antitoxin system TacA family antitoxin [Croceibacterium sp.]